MYVSLHLEAHFDQYLIVGLYIGNNYTKARTILY